MKETFRGELGYRGTGRGARDIMDTSRAVEPEAFFDTDKLKGKTPSVDFTTGRESAVSSSSTSQDQTQSRTLLQAITPGKEYGLKGVATSNMMRSEKSAVAGGTRLKATAQQHQSDVKGQMNQIKTDVKQAQKEAMNAVKEAAKGEGVSPMAAEKTLGRDAGSGKIAAGAAMAGEALSGGLGSFATMGKAVFVAVGLSKQEKQLDPKEQERIIASAIERLQSSGTNETAADVESTVSLDGPKDSEFNWDITSNELRQLLDLDSNDPELPEYNDLDNSLHFLQDVENNYGALANNEGATFQEGFVDSDLNAVEEFGKAAAVDAGAVATTGMTLRGFETFATHGAVVQHVAFDSVSLISPVFEVASTSFELEPPLEMTQEFPASST